VHDGGAAEIEQVLPFASIAGAAALPATDVRQGVLHCHALAQLSAAGRRRLALAQLDQQALTG
jgi:hypothetical protein